MTTAPFGSWPSPISAAEVARGGVGLSAVTLGADGSLWWEEARRSEGGRSVVLHRPAVGGEPVEVLPTGWSAVTRVHEYGGAAWCVLPDGALVVAREDDQRLWRVPAGSSAAAPLAPVALTPAPTVPLGWRYADMVPMPGGAGLVCVRESHVDDPADPVRHELVAVPLDGSGAVRVLASGADFVISPSVSPDGRSLAYVAWDHPRMPWDGTELRLLNLASGAVTVVAGGAQESLLQPAWSPSGVLHVLSDRTGWWNLYRVAADAGGLEPLCPLNEECGSPPWQLGYRTYGFLAPGVAPASSAPASSAPTSSAPTSSAPTSSAPTGGAPTASPTAERVALLHGVGRLRLGVLDPATGHLDDLDLPVDHWTPTLAVAGGLVAGVAGSATRPWTVLTVEAASGAVDLVRASVAPAPDPAWVSVGNDEVLPGPAGREVHARVHPPTSPTHDGPAGALPPYIAFVHGGPTAASPPVLQTMVAYFTSRGFGVVDVQYGGSTGYGRAYRERLRGQWGVVDVEDTVAAVRALVDRGLADGARLAVRGGSAGGWTVLGALTRTGAFAAGCSFFGVVDAVALAQDTHDFESRYLDSMIAPWPAGREVYVERSPLSHLAGLSCPLLVLQGLADPVVPPAQAQALVDALTEAGIPHAYLAFPGERHGFRKAENVVAWLEAELSFYGQVLCGLDPPGVPRLALTPPLAS